MKQELEKARGGVTELNFHRVGSCKAHPLVLVPHLDGIQLDRGHRSAGKRQRRLGQKDGVGFREGSLEVDGTHMGLGRRTQAVEEPPHLLPFGHGRIKATEHWAAGLLQGPVVSLVLSEQSGGGRQLVPTRVQRQEIRLQSRPGLVPGVARDEGATPLTKVSHGVCEPRCISRQECRSIRRNWFLLVLSDDDLLEVKSWEILSPVFFLLP